MRTRAIATLFALMLVPNADAQVVGITREGILTRAREYTSIQWDIDGNGNGSFDQGDTSATLHDKPNYRYRRSRHGTCSPLVNWFTRFPGGNERFLVDVLGAPYAMGKKLSPAAAAAWVHSVDNEHCTRPVGLSGDQYDGLQEADRNFAGAVDCSGLVSYAAGKPGLGTCGILEDVVYFRKYCRHIDYDNCTPGPPWDDWLVPSKGDFLVKCEDHAVVVVYVTLYEVGVIESTGNDDYEGCGEHPYGSTFPEMLNYGFRGVSVRSLMNNPETAFLNVNVAREGESARVTWTTLYLKDTWGFAVQHSEDGLAWEKVGEYVLPSVQTSNAQMEFSELVALPMSGYVRVVELETQTGRPTPSLPVPVTESEQHR